MIKKIAARNKGVHWERVNYEFGDGRPNPEKIFQEVWDEWNSPDRSRGRGMGMAQGLFIVPKRTADVFSGPERDDINYSTLTENDVCVYKLTAREHRVIATMMQWLGTNVGFGFLHEALGRSGYEIASLDSPRMNLREPIPKRSRYEMVKKALKANHKENVLIFNPNMDIKRNAKSIQK